jgi:hypothetical protein
MSNKVILLRGQGRLKVAQYDAAGILGGYRFVGNCPMLKIEPKTAMIDHREDQTGNRYKDVKITDTSDLSVSFSLEQFDDANLALAFFGDTTVELGTGTFTQALGTVVAGLDYKFGKPGFTVTTITDSAEVPAVIPAGSYTVNKDGTVTFADLGAFVQPFHVAGSKSASSTTTILSRSTPVIALLFEGLNTATSRTPIIVDIPRISLNPAKGLDLIGTTFAKLEMDGEALYDANSIGSGIMSGFGSITRA